MEKRLRVVLAIAITLTMLMQSVAPIISVAQSEATPVVDANPDGEDADGNSDGNTPSGNPDGNSPEGNTPADQGEGDTATDPAPPTVVALNPVQLNVNWLQAACGVPSILNVEGLVNNTTQITAVQILSADRSQVVRDLRDGGTAFQVDSQGGTFWLKITAAEGHTFTVDGVNWVSDDNGATARAELVFAAVDCTVTLGPVAWDGVTAPDLSGILGIAGVETAEFVPTNNVDVYDNIVVVKLANGYTFNELASLDWTIDPANGSIVTVLAAPMVSARSLGAPGIMPLAAPGSGDVSENFSLAVTANPTTVPGNTNTAVELSVKLTANQNPGAQDGDFIIIDLGAPFTPQNFPPGVTLFRLGDPSMPWATLENVPGTSQLKITFLPLADSHPNDQEVEFKVISTNVWVYDPDPTANYFDVTVGTDSQEVQLTVTEPPVVPTPTPVPPSIKPAKSAAWADADDRGRVNPNQALIWTIQAPTGDVSSATLIDTVQGTNWQFSCDPSGNAIVAGSGGATYESAKCVNGDPTKVEITWGKYNTNTGDRPFIKLYGDILQSTGAASPDTYAAGPFDNHVQVTQIADRDGVEVDAATLVCDAACATASIQTETHPNPSPKPFKYFDWATGYELKNDGTVTGEGRENNGVEAIIWTIRAPIGPAQSVTITDSFDPAMSAAGWKFVCDPAKITISPSAAAATITNCTETSVTVVFGPYTNINESTTPYIKIKASITDTQPANAREILKEFKNCAVVTDATNWNGQSVTLPTDPNDRSACAARTQTTPRNPHTDIAKTGDGARWDNGEYNSFEALEWTIPLPGGPNNGVTVVDKAPLDGSWEFSCSANSITITPPGSVTVFCTPNEITIVSADGYDRGTAPVVKIKANLLIPFKDGQEFKNDRVTTVVNDYAANSTKKFEGTGQGKWVQESYFTGGGTGNPNAKVSIGNYIWIDTDRDGTQNEVGTGVDGLTVKIYEGNSVDESKLVGTTTTAHGGWYGFNDLKSNTQYTLSFEKKAGYEWTAMEQGGNVALDSNVNPATGTHTFTSPPNGDNRMQWEEDPGNPGTVINTGLFEDDPTRDAGLITMVSIGDYVWFDYNRNGQQDSGERALGDVPVALYKWNGTAWIPAGTTTTSPTGYYEFLGLEPDTQYQLRFTLPDGYDGWTAQNSNMVSPPASTEALPGAWGTTDSDVDKDGIVTFMTPSTGRNQSGPGNTDNPNLDAGVVINKVSIGDYVWYDMGAGDHMNNGIQDDDEKPAAKIPVTLKDASDNVVATTTTDDDGYYFFTDLDPKTPYSLEFGKPNGYAWTKQNQGGDDAKDSDVNSAGVVNFTSPEFGENRPWKVGSDFEPYKQNADNPTLDAGLVQLVSVGDYVWYDVDRDGQQDTGEPPVEGVVVKIRLEGSSTYITDTVTDKDGYYAFNDLLPNTKYVIEFTKPTEFTDWTDQNKAGVPDNVDSDVDPYGVIYFTSYSGANPQNLTDPGMADDSTQDAGLVKKVSIGDYVWFDNDFDGMQDDDEPGVEGALVYLYDKDGNPVPGVAPAVTDKNGYYFFKDLYPDTDYQLKFVHNQTGYGWTKQDAAGNDKVDSDVDQQGWITNVRTPSQGKNLTAPETTDVPTYDAGIVKLVSVGDYVWFDYDRDGKQGSHAKEEPIAGVKVTLKRVDGIEPDRSTTTDANGYYNFKDLYPGADYELIFDKPENYDDWTTQYAPGTTDANDSDVDADGKIAFKAPSPIGAKNEIGPDKADNPRLDAGLVIKKVSIGDYVWYDTNLDGLQDDTELPVQNLKVTLYDKDGTEVGTTTTDSDGYYYFKDLEPKTEYSVVFEKPANYGFTKQNVGDDAKDSDPDANGKVTFTTPEFGKNQPWARSGVPQPYVKDLADDPTIDAGLVKLVSIGDYVWYDANRDGKQAPGETPISKVKVTITGPNGFTASTETDDNGFYFFKDLYPDTGYDLTFELPDGYTEWTTQGGGDTWSDPTTWVGDDSNVDASGKASVVTPKTGDNKTDPGQTDNPTIDAGVVKKVSIGDYVWYDANRDGKQTPGETPIGKVKVTITGPNGFTATTETDDNGYYFFKDLYPETEYELTFAMPEGYNEWTTPGGGDNWSDPTSWVGDDSNVDANGKAKVTTPSQGKNLTDPGKTDNPTIDAGLIKKVSIGDYVWYDANRDGKQTPGETPISKVKVTITGPNGFTATTETDDNGYYFFKDLYPETEYELTFGLPDGYTEWTAQGGGDDWSDPTTWVGNDSNVDANGKAKVTTPSQGKNLTDPGKADNPTIDAGVVIKVSVGDYVWYDANKDGIQDPTEAPVPGVKVTLYDKDGKKVGETTTDSDGYYFFKDLYPDTEYSVVFEKPDGFAGWTGKEQGGDPARDSNVGPDGKYTFVTKSTGKNLTAPDKADDPTIDAGLIRLVSVGDYVWYDSNGNGKQDPGEKPAKDIKVTLYDKDGNKVGETTTDETGYYYFKDLEPGTEYKLVFGKPSGYNWTQKGVGNNKETDSDVNYLGEIVFTSPTSGNNLIGPNMTDNPTLDAGLVVIPAEPPVVEELPKTGSGTQANSTFVLATLAGMVMAAGAVRLSVNKRS
ncbi:MAG: carboxypeptidase regulatory-like domain-containing protein [Thermomicrobiales bacterium]|nr:carboxypeptidase regulatory-like domain-containing protein [Thermomicrobiales bacterium]